MMKNKTTKENIKLIASDLDGTILQNGARQLPEGFCELIMQLKSHGIYFVAASGRQYNNIRRLFAPIQDEIAYIAENGALCVLDNVTLRKGSLPMPLGHKMIDIIHRYPDGQCLVSGEKICYTDSKDATFIHEVRHKIGYDMEVVEDLKDAVKEPYLKVSGYSLSGAHNLEQYLRDAMGHEAQVVTSGNVWVDFVCPGFNKGNSLKALTEHLHLQPENCIAFGDQYNDVEMLQFVKTSYAMSNSAPGISYYSTNITDSVPEVLEDILAWKKTLL